MRNVKAPAHLDLVEAYLSVHFAGKTAAVFFAPLDHHDAIARRLRLPFRKRPDLIMGDIYVHEMPATKVNGFVNCLDEDQYGFVVAWDGAQYTTENT